MISFSNITSGIPGVIKGDVTNLVAETLGGNDSDLIADTLVGLEVERQLGVVTLDDDLSGTLDCLLWRAFSLELIFFLSSIVAVVYAHLGTDATHFGGLLLAGWMFERPSKLF